MMEKREKVSRSIVMVFLIFCGFTVLQILSPLLLPIGSITDLSGSVGVIDNSEMYEDIPFPLDIPYHCGDRLCHQKLERSFVLNGNQMSFCSRCTAIWIGLTIGLFVMMLCSIDLNERFLGLLILCLVPIGIDGTGQLLGFWESTNVTRVLTGLIIGIPVGLAIGIIIDEIQILYKTKTT